MKTKSLDESFMISERKKLKYSSRILSSALERYKTDLYYNYFTILSRSYLIYLSFLLFYSNLKRSTDTKDLDEWLGKCYISSTKNHWIGSSRRFINDHRALF